jgi:hypothetical protein
LVADFGEPGVAWVEKQTAVGIDSEVKVRADPAPELKAVTRSRHDGEGVGGTPGERTTIRLAPSYRHEIVRKATAIDRDVKTSHQITDPANAAVCQMKEPPVEFPMNASTFLAFSMDMKCSREIVRSSYIINM